MQDFAPAHLVRFPNPLALTKASEVGNLTNACQAKPQCSVVGKIVLWASKYFRQASVVGKPQCCGQDSIVGKQALLAGQYCGQKCRQFYLNLYVYLYLCFYLHLYLYLYLYL